MVDELADIPLFYSWSTARLNQSLLLHTCIPVLRYNEVVMDFNTENLSSVHSAQIFFMSKK